LKLDLGCYQSGVPDRFEAKISVHLRSEFRRPSGTQIPMDGQPGDKLPGYYRVSLRDEGKTGFQMSKLQGPSGRKHNRALDRYNL
jgi:hypothetical protein